MSDPFTHLHVSSGYSLQYGASHPHVLVERAAEQEMDTLALTDRDGTYGAVKFAQACGRAGIRPVLGVNLAYRGAYRGRYQGAIQALLGRCSSRTPIRTPTRGGAYRDLPLERGGLARAMFLASADTHGGRAGWAALCRLISAVQLAGERGSPGPRPRRAPGRGGCELLGSGDLVVLLGPDVRGRASPRPVAATTWPQPRPAPWQALVPRTHLVVELVSHRLPGVPTRSGAPAPRPHAARMAGLAQRHGLERGAHQRGALRRPPRRGHHRRPRRRPPAGGSRPAPPRAPQRRGLPQVRQADARGRRGDRHRLAGLGERAPPGCSPRPASSPTGALSTRAPTSGWGRCTSRSSSSPTARARARRSADQALRSPVRGRGRSSLRHRPPAGDLEAARRRARADPRPRLRLVLPHRRRRHRPDPRDGGAVRRARARARAAWSTTCSGSPASTRSGTAC